MSPIPVQRLRGVDYALLGGLCLVLFGFALIDGRVLTTHETAHCQNVREMLADGDWIIPKYGGRPWLERPPLPHWITGALVQLSGQPEREWPYRLGPLLMGTVTVWLVAWVAGLWFGRAVGLLGGAILATMREFTVYATGPEADIFLCTLVTAALALFVRVEFSGETHPDERLLGRRPWTVLAFFVMLALTNLAKGLIFGTLFVLVPAVGFLVWNGDRLAWRRYFWLWGWLTFVVVALAWPTAALLRYPDVVDLWLSDYAGRLHQNYMRQPPWYYLTHWPWVVFPWTVPALAGLWLTRGRALRQRRAPERFLWCWALLPIAFFSIPQGKHHHYLLQCLAPWAVLAALGTVKVWEFVRAPECAASTWAVMLRDGRRAAGVLFTVLIVLNLAADGYRTRFLDRYRADSAFLREAQTLAPSGAPIFVVGDHHPLNASWFLFYLGAQASFLHNQTFALDERIEAREVYLISRFQDWRSLTFYGAVQALLQSEYTKGEQSPAERWTLFRLRFHEDLARKPGTLRISPMQATGRAPGPFLR